jgi:uncharacterized protein (DUF983 family)
MPDTLTDPVLWSPRNPDMAQSWAKPGALTAMLRGASGRCPSCGKGRLFRGWLRQVDSCDHCAAPLGAVRADDAPPYFVIFIVGHLVIGTQIALDGVMGLSLLAEAAIFLPLTLAASMALLRPAKGATIGLMLQLGLVPARDA